MNKKVLIPFFFLITLSFLTSCRKKAMKMQSQYIFGTICSIDLFEDGTEELYAGLFERLNQIERKFSVNIADSELSFVNSNASEGPVVVSREFFDVLKFSVDFAEKSGGAFNPALGSIIGLWGIGTEHQRIPETQEIEEAKKHCDYRNIILNEADDICSVMLADEKLRLDLGAIVKGYAADELVKLLKENGVTKAIINLGGNIYAFGSKSNNPDDKWNIGIKNPLKDDAEPIVVLEVNSTSVVTSGNYERFFIENGVRYHHIIDSKTGFPAETGLASVTVINESSTLCDAMATACFVAGTDAEFIKNEAGPGKIQLIFITQDGKIVKK